MRSLSLLLVVSLLLTSCGADDTPLSQRVFHTATVESRVLGATETIHATVEGKTSTNISFKVPGRITAVMRDIGDHVEAGDILATIDTTQADITVADLGDTLSHISNMSTNTSDSLEATTHMRDTTDALYGARLSVLDIDARSADADRTIASDNLDLAKRLLTLGQSIGSGTIANVDTAILQASANRAIAETNYTAGIVVLSGTLVGSAESVRQAERSLDLANTNYEAGSAVLSGTLVGSSESIDQAQKALDLANNNLTNTKDSLDTELDTIIQNGKSSLAGGYVVAQNARDLIDTTLSVTPQNANTNSSFASYLGARDGTTKKAAEDAFRTWNTHYEAMETWYLANINGTGAISEDTMRQGLSDASNVLGELRDVLHTFTTMLDNTLVG